MGKANKSFFAYYKSGKKLMINFHYFFIFKKKEYKINLKEVEKVLEIDLKDFIYPEKFFFLKKSFS